MDSLNQSDAYKDAAEALEGALPGPEKVDPNAASLKRQRATRERREARREIRDWERDALADASSASERREIKAKADSFYEFSEGAATPEPEDSQARPNTTLYGKTNLPPPPDQIDGIVVVDGVLRYATVQGTIYSEV